MHLIHRRGSVRADVGDGLCNAAHLSAVSLWVRVMFVRRSFMFLYVRRFCVAFWRVGENFEAVIGHSEGVFELCA